MYHHVMEKKNNMLTLTLAEPSFSFFFYSEKKKEAVKGSLAIRA